MNEGLNNTKQTEKISHLKEGVKHIMAYIGTAHDHLTQEGKGFYDFRFGDAQMHKIDYYNAHLPEYVNHDFLNAGEETYIISPIDSLDKFSEEFYDCVGLVVAGIDKKTKKNVSFATHQNPKRFAYDKKDNFIADLQQRLKQIDHMCEEETVDAVIIGGNYKEDKNILNIPYKEMYKKGVTLTSAQVKEVLGFEPSVINGPKNTGGHDDMYYQNDERRLYFVRPTINKSTKDFTISNIEEEKPKWDK